MAKVIQTILNMRDNMSKGLIAAARNTQGVTRDMQRATREAVNFKNRAGKAIASFAKTAGTALAATGGALVGAFLAMDGATEEYRVAQGKLNTAFEAAGMSADAARTSYRNFYAILGDTDTATEASQLLSKLTKNEEDITKWTRIAAGVSGTFGDSLPIEGLIEASNETARVGQVTGVLADAINWAAKEGETFGVKLKANTKANEDWNKAVSEAKSAEDFFNLALQDCATESERVQLIMDTLSGTYDKAADSFYKANKQLVDSRRNQATLQEITAKLGDASATVKNQLWELAGAQEDGAIRAGSALDFFSDKINTFSSWISGLDLGALSAQFDQGFATAVDKASDALTWLIENKDSVIGAIQGIAGAFVVFKTIKLVGDIAGAINNVKLFGQTVGLVATTNLPKIGSGLKTAAGAIGGFGSKIAGLLAANPIILGIVTAIGAVVLIGMTLYRNWDQIKAGAIALWESAKTTFEGFKETISNAFQAVKDRATELWEKITETFTGIKDAIVGAFEAAKDKVAGFFSWIDDKVSNLPVVGGVYNGIKGAISWVGDKLGGNALGTSYWRGGLTYINERGGEIVDLPNGTKIIPHDISTRAAERFSDSVYALADKVRRIAPAQKIAEQPLALGSGIHLRPLTPAASAPVINLKVEVQGNVIGNEQYADEVGEVVVRKVLTAYDNM